MKIGLINFNHRGFLELGVPPVPPIGLEYLVDNLVLKNHEAYLLDLCFLDPKEKTYAIEDFVYGKDVIGITLRNIGIDNFRMLDQQFFADELRQIVKIVQGVTSVPIVLGGQGFSIYPHDILDYVNADFGISGPGEIAFCNLLGNIHDVHRGTIFTGIPNLGIVHHRALIDYGPYISNGGSPAIQTKIGCKQNCGFCVEKTKIVRKRELNAVFEELKLVLNRKFQFIYIAVAEFNSDILQANQFCDRILQESIKFSWSAYLNPIPLTEELVKKMKAAGCVMPCISVTSGDDNTLKTLETGFSIREIRRMAEWFHKYDFPFSVDILFGSPGETIDSSKKTIALMNEIQPNVIGMNLGLRIYNDTNFGRRFIAKEFPLDGTLYGKVENNDNLFFPIFYISDINIEKYLQDICDSDKRYRLLGYSGFEGVNYKVASIG